MDYGDDEDVRVGVVRPTMLSNPLIAKRMGKNATTVDHNKVYGKKNVKSDGGAAEALKVADGGTMSNERILKARQRRPHLQPAEVGRSRQPLSKEAADLVHGKKSHKDAGVDSVLAGWEETERKAGKVLRPKPEVGRARLPHSKDIEDRVHGKVLPKGGNGTAEALSNWDTDDDVSASRRTKNPLLAKSGVGQARPPPSASMLTKVYGKKSQDPTVEGGVNGSLHGWGDRPDTQQENERLKKMTNRVYKPELGRARPPASSGIDDMVHGIANKKTDGGTSAALSDWKPDTPGKFTRRKVNVPQGDMSFGKPSGKSEGVADLISHKTGKEWLRQKLSESQKQEQNASS